MSDTTRPQTDQIVHDPKLIRMGLPVRSTAQSIIAAVHQYMEFPLRMHQGDPADSKVYFEPNLNAAPDGTNRTTPPTKSTIPSIAASTVDFSNGTTTGATFDFDFPTTTTGNYRRVGFTLLASGAIKGIFSAEAASVGALANPGTLFVKTGIPIGYVDLTTATAAVISEVAQEYTLHNNNVPFGSGATTKLAIPVNIATAMTVTTAQTKLRRVSGSAGSITVKFVKDSGSWFPSAAGGDVLGTTTFTAASMTNGVDHDVTVSVNQAIPSGRYWLVIEGDATYNASGGVTARYFFGAAPEKPYWQYNGSSWSDNLAYGIYHVVNNAGPKVITSHSSIGSGLGFSNTNFRSHAVPITLASSTAVGVLAAYIWKLGSPGGNLDMKLVKDAAGLPSLNPIDVVAQTSIPISSITAAFPSAQFPNLVVNQTLPAGTYWFTFGGDSAYQASYSSGTHSIATYRSSGPTAYTFDGTSWSNLIGIGVVHYAYESLPPSGGYKTVGSLTDVIENAGITLFGSGGGGGGGAGDTTGIEEDLKARLRTSLFQWLTPNVFSKHETLRVDPSSTAQSQIAEDNLYLFDSAGDFVRSIEHYDTNFLEADTENAQAELMAFWDSAAIDTSAIYQLSRDGGTTFQTVSMERVGLSNAFRGLHVFADETTHATLASQATVTTGFALNATTAQKRAQSFVVTDKSRLRVLSLFVTKTLSPAGTFTVKIVKDSSGSPSSNVEDIVYDGVPQNSSSLTAGNSTLTFDMKKPILPGTYWIVVETDAFYKAGIGSGTISLRGGATAAVDGKIFNGTVWSTDTGNDLGFTLQGMVYSLIVRIESSAGAKKLTGYGVFYGEEGVNPPLQGVDQSQVFSVNGSLDTTQFTITRFLPDSRRLRVYDTNTGQVWRWPKFGVDGSKVVFAAGSFLSPGETIILIFDQSEGSGFDNSDTNAALLAANRLGSSDPTIDRSVAGEGPLIRASNGTLVEASLQWNGSAYEWVFAEVL